MTFHRPDLSGLSRGLQRKAETALQIAKVAMSSNGWREPLLAFSGGKDALSVAVLLHHLLQEPFRAICEASFMFPLNVEENRRNAERLKIAATFRDSLSYEWLREHPRYIFPQGDDRTRFFALRQWRTIESFADEVNASLIFFGRRTQENTVPDVIYEKKHFTFCHPLREWREEDVWEWLAWAAIPRPWIYSTPYGKDQGTGPWNIYQGADGWDGIEATDPEYCHYIRSQLYGDEETIS